jgi:hypothetical protein
MQRLEEGTQLAKLGEVIEAGTASFVSQCYELHRPPPLGGLVKASDGPIDVFGVVCSAETRSIEEGRKPMARGAVGSDEDVYRAHPQLAQLLCTDFKAIIVGHRSEGTILQYLPPRPARIHSFTYECGPDEIRALSGSTGFLRLIVMDQSPWIDEVISACLRGFSQAHQDPETFLLAAGRELAVLLQGDFQRLANIVKRVRGQ